MNKRFTTRRIALCGLLLSMMLILGWVEKQIALPSGIKLGLSNSVLLFAVYMLDLPTAVVLMILKVTLTNLLFGNFGSTFMMGFAGGTLSLAAMILISRLKGIHPVVVSIVGGVMHIVGQVIMGMIIGVPAVVAMLPYLMVSGAFFGALTGVCATRVMKYMKHMRL